MHLRQGWLWMEGSQPTSSGHFVWVDQPDVIVDAVKLILDKVDSPG
ncbi:hypothetical protein LC607_11465 [Nostoc sp. CHAB 5824]|nr:hypothetical protein [Nostoc sp. CHAB 5824]